MGACCSTPQVAHDTLNRAPHVELPRHQTDALEDMVHVLATVHSSPSQMGVSVPNQHHHHHHHRHQHGSRHSSRDHTPKQLLRAASPQQQLEQHQPYGLSPRSFQQLQQLLPSAPLQHLATAQAQAQLASPSTLLQQQGKIPGRQAANTASSAFVSAQAQAVLAQHNHQHSIRGRDAVLAPSLQQLQSMGSGGSISSTRSGVSTTVSAGLVTANSRTPADALSAPQVLALCAAVVGEDSAFQAAGITPLLLASLCLIESGGCPQAKQYREHVGDTAHGLCQMVLSTAQWLASSQGFAKHGTTLAVEHLQDPKTCVYFAAAYLAVLSHYEGSARSEDFVTRAYHAGPKGVETAAAHAYLQKYLKAKHCLTAVVKAMAVTVAAAALAAHVQLPAAGGAAAADADGGPAAATAEEAADAGVRVALVISTDSRDSPGKDQGTASAAPAAAGANGGKQCSSVACRTSSSPGEDGTRQVHIRRATADLVATLCSTWGEPVAAAAAGHATAPGGLGAGSILAHVLPNWWGLNGSRMQQQQQQERGLIARASSAATTADNALELVGVCAADVAAAWRRLLSMSPDIAQASLRQAAAAAALAPHPADDPIAAQPEQGTAAVGAAATSNTASAASPRRSSSRCSSPLARGGNQAASAGDTAAGEAEPAGQQLESMPCVIHVVGPGETLERIARVCKVAVHDLLTANPEVVDTCAVRQNDCIALPVPAVFPRLYVVQAGDSLHSIARAHDVTVGRLLAKNPELIDPSRLQPGWVVALPGLKGDSQVALPLDWLTQTSLNGDSQQLHAAGAVGQCGAAQRQHQQPWPAAAAQQHQQPATGSHISLLSEATSWPAAGRRSLQQQQQQGRQGRGRAARLQAVQSAPDQQQQQHEPPALPTFGSGAYLFTVNSDGRAGAGLLPAAGPAAGLAAAAGCSMAAGPRSSSGSSSKASQCRHLPGHSLDSHQQGWPVSSGEGARAQHCC